MERRRPRRCWQAGCCPARRRNGRCDPRQRGPARLGRVRPRPPPTRWPTTRTPDGWRPPAHGRGEPRAGSGRRMADAGLPGHVPCHRGRVRDGQRGLVSAPRHTWAGRWSRFCAPALGIRCRPISEISGISRPGMFGLEVCTWSACLRRCGERTVLTSTAAGSGTGLDGHAGGRADRVEWPGVPRQSGSWLRATVVDWRMHSWTRRP